MQACRFQIHVIKKTFYKKVYAVVEQCGKIKTKEEEKKAILMKIENNATISFYEGALMWINVVFFKIYLYLKSYLLTNK